ncbi:MAG: hypothetical protein GXO63_00255 [Candidatus Micrarchaeota archaeon]|nr:hypothetical protein [Candidatus Micrarchaeota archaeon]
MFLMVGENRCPSCGIVGETWKKKPEVFKCPSCNAIFNEFGIIAPGVEKELEFT